MKSIPFFITYILSFRESALTRILFSFLLFTLLITGCTPKVTNTKLDQLKAAATSDKSAPDILLFDSPPAVVAGGTVLKIPIQASDGSGIVNYKLQYSEDSTQFTDVGQASSTDSSISWTAPKVDRTNVVLKLVASDLNKNESSQLSKPFAIDSTPPPAPSIVLASSVNTSQSTASFTVSQCNNELNSILISSGAEAPSPSDSAWQKCSTATAGLTYILSVEGRYSLSAWSKDLAGNVSLSASSPMQVTYDVTPPATPNVVLTSTNPTSVTAATFTVSSCSDSPYLYISESASSPLTSTSGWVTCNTGASATAFTLSAAQGAKTVYFWAQDTAGNISSSPATVNVTLTTVAATVSSVTVQTGLTVDVAFSGVMGAGVTSAANYTVSGTGKGTLSTHPSSVALVSGNTYRLTWASGKMYNGGDITISTASMLDQAGNTVISSGTHTAGAIATPPSTPTGIALITPASSPGNNTTPTFRISGVSSGDTIAIYTSSSCTVPSLKASNTASAATIDLTSSALAQGTYTFYAKATDAALNTSACSTANVNYVLDTTAPTVAITTPSASSYVKNSNKASVTVSGSCSENGRTVNVSVTDSGSGNVVATPTCNTGSSPQWTTTLDFTALADGTVTIATSHTDAAGNSTNATSVSITKDVVIPTVSTVAVQTGLTVDVTFSEAMGSGVTTAANYTLSGTGIGTLASHPNSVALVSGNKYRLTWSSGEMFNGGDINIAVVTAQDLAGNPVNSDATHTAGGIGTAPSIPSGLSLVTPASSPGNNTTPTIRISGVTSGDIVSLFTSSSCTAISQKASGTASGTTIDLTSSALTDATYNFYANAKDAAGNTSACSSASVTYVLSTGLPVVTITTPVDLSYVNNAGKASVTVSGSCDQNGRAVNVSATDSGATSVSASPTCNTAGSPKWSATLDFTTLVDGTITLAATHDDGAGNTGHASNVTVTKDIVVPTVSTVAVQTGLTVDVTFSEAMSTGVTTAANYTLSGTGKGTLAANPNSVALVSGNKYRLTWSSGNMYNGGDITIAVANAQDLAGNTISSNGTHTAGAIGNVPSAPSALALVTPAASPGNSTTPTIRVSGVASGQTVAIYTSSSCAIPALKASNTASGITIDLTSSAIAAGTYTFYANTVDAAGNTSSCSTASVTYVLDTTPPTLAISTPSASSWVGNSGKTSVTVSGSCSEDTRSVTVTATDSGSTSVSATPTCSTSLSPNWTTTLDFSTLTDGAITLSASQSDAAGNSANASNVSISLDTVVPTASITSPTGFYAGGASLTLNFSASDAASGLASLKVQYASDGSTFSDVAAVATNATSYNWTVPMDNVATAKVRILATDTAGNTNTATSSAFTIDSAAPTISLTSFNGGAVYTGSSQTITWTASDLTFGSTPIAIDYSTNGGTSWTNITAGVANSGSYNWTVPSIATTTNAKIKITATDGAGTSSTAVSSSAFKISGAPTNANVGCSTPITAGTCQMCTASLKDSGNSNAYNASGSAIVITLSSGGWGTFYSNPTCTTTATSASIPNTGTSVHFYYKSNLANASITITGSNATVPLTDDTVTVAVVPAAASQMSFSTQPSTTATAGTNFSTQPAVTLKDAFGNTITAVTPTVNLTAFTDSTCTVLASGSLTASATAPSSGVATFSGVQYSQQDTVYLKASASGTTPACSNAVAVSGTPTQFTISGTNSVSSNFCSSALTVKSKDSNGNAANVSSNQTVALSSSLGGTFYTDSTCSSSTSSIQINSGTSTAAFYFKDTTQESPTLTASTSGFTSGTFVMKVQDVTQISGGGNFVCSLVNGAVYCWGKNSVGKLGNNSVNDSNVPVQAYGLSSGVSHIAMGASTGCAVVNGAAQCWGLNTYGQVGDNTTGTNRLIPTQVYGLTTNVTAVASGQYNGCAIVNGGAQCWGKNTNGQLGNNSNVDSSIPVQVQGLTSGVTSIAIGYDHVCAVVSGGVQCWGKGVNGQLGNNTTVDSWVPVQVQGLTSGVSSVAASYLNNCALLTNGSVQCWGSGGYGLIGNNGFSISKVPVQATGLTSGVTAIAGAGGSGPNFCAIVSGGAKCWGDYSNGQVGNGSYSGGSATSTGVTVPTQVTGLTSGVTAITAGYQSCAIVNGNVQCWGNNANGNIGNGTGYYGKIPALVSGVSNGNSLSTSTSADLFSALLSDGSLLSWGDNTQKALGIGTSTFFELPTQTIGMSTGVSAVTAGAQGGCAIVSGSLKCWGYNGNGQIGDNSTTTQGTAVQTLGLTSGVTQVSRGVNYSCAVVSGSIQCWGANTSGQLGNNSTVNSLTAVQVTGLTSGATQVNTGNSSTCAVVNGGAQCWGHNGYGRLGINSGSVGPFLVPTQVYGLTSGVTQIASGNTSACALVNGGVQCWGGNGNGQLGNNLVPDSTVPVQVMGLTSGVSQIATGYYATCALVNGGVQCWGDNSYGQLGNNTLTLSRVPVQVKGLTSGVNSIGAANHSFCAVMDNGTVNCWGNNDSAQLGYVPYVLAPTLVGPWP